MKLSLPDLKSFLREVALGARCFLLDIVLGPAEDFEFKGSTTPTEPPADHR